MIWVDASGNVQSTTVLKGTHNTSDTHGNWQEIHFGNGGKAVATVHSHPILHANNVQGAGPTINTQGNFCRLTTTTFS